MQTLLNILKKLLGKKLTRKIRPLGHGIKSWLAAAYYGFPGRKLTMIGINATKGKTTTTIYAGRIFNLAGLKTGYVSTAVINATGKTSDEELNKSKMTTVDGFILQKKLHEMVKSGCKYAILEMSSQGLEQNRHWGIGGFDMTVFMNLYPEHLESHGGLDKYIEAKSKLFKSSKPKCIFVATGQPEQLEYMDKMWQSIPQHIRSTCKKVLLTPNKDFSSQATQNSIFKTLSMYGKTVKTEALADFDISNLAFALTICNQYKNIQQELETITSHVLYSVPGRMEFVIKNSHKKGKQYSPFPIDILVDYAHEPESMKQLLETLSLWKSMGVYTQVIHNLSCDGAGRDDWKKPVMGDLSYQHSDYTILTTDNYDQEDNPYDIVDLLAKNYPKDTLNKKYESHIDRKTAFRVALNKAYTVIQKDPAQRILIVSTGVGSEQGLTQPNGRILWDERKVWAELYTDFTSTI